VALAGDYGLKVRVSLNQVGDIGNVYRLGLKTRLGARVRLGERCRVMEITVGFPRGGGGGG
jgi:hypothetical protein